MKRAHRPSTLSLSPFLFLLLCGVLGALPAAAEPAAEPAAETVIYLVRHGEKVLDGSRDPALTREGLERAAALAELLRDAGVTRIHSSDLIRTRRTAQPLADRLGLAVETYDPRDLEALAAKLRSIPGRHLVSGHSDTTPELVRLLGGAPGGAIDEPTEYDRLYVVVLGEDGGTTTVLLRYGR